MKELTYRITDKLILLIGIFCVLAVFVVLRKQLFLTPTSNRNIDQTFTSRSLGIAFNYSATDDLGSRIFVKQAGSKVYIYDEKTQTENGQSVEVFSKKPEQTLEQAINEKFLAGYNPQDCFLKAGTDINGTLPLSGIAAVIAFPPSTDPNSDGLDNATKCPVGYSVTNGVSYFWTDQAASDTFVFFNIGQYYIPGGQGTLSWHNTLEFI